MKLRNKKTGEIGKILKQLSEDNQLEVITDNKLYVVKTLAELNEEWEDYEDVLCYIISAEHKDGYICALKEDYEEICDTAKKLGIGFETEKECQEFCNKLLAWKRLKDKGFRFNGKEVFSEGLLEIDGVLPALKGAGNAERLKIIDDLDLIFGGEE